MSLASAAALLLGVVVAPLAAAAFAAAAGARRTERSGARAWDALTGRPVLAAATAATLGGLLLVVVVLLALGTGDRGYAVTMGVFAAVLAGLGAAYALRQGEAAGG